MFRAKMYLKLNISDQRMRRERGMRMEYLTPEELNFRKLFYSANHNSVFKSLKKWKHFKTSTYYQLYS